MWLLCEIELTLLCTRRKRKREGGDGESSLPSLLYGKQTGLPVQIMCCYFYPENRTTFKNSSNSFFFQKNDSFEKKEKLTKVEFVFIVFKAGKEETGEKRVLTLLLRPSSPFEQNLKE